MFSKIRWLLFIVSAGLYAGTSSWASNVEDLTPNGFTNPSIAYPNHATGVYVEGGIGLYSGPINLCDYFDCNDQSTVQANPLDSFVMHLDGGYQFSPYVGLEVGTLGVLLTNQEDGSADMNATLYEAMRFTQPIKEHFSLFEKLGVMEVLGAYAPDIVSGSGITWLFIGVGVGYSFNANWTVSASVEDLPLFGFGLAFTTVDVSYHF
ncbi:MAG: hypothetical protein A3J38_07930 [Gammaproteobacteria bacterium RIFCSPHIGHO2_12_FULL_45_9]|nr:MAG: hypothetical protein A3J38_07930 [Gammaproteobacteria bacterium RIFCSPHIGHO2_12_FULL_45_9]